MKVVYVLTSDEKDYFLEELYLSSYSLKKYNEVTSILYTDNDTNESFKIDNRKKC
ncbi:hypothetical protein [Candidatus Stoquefichus sp. SB1]|uniref:hypothetical protein n=1 Tax=Candidatus Stoquefichus sp. SB1 TaxID=1658109 RepID=UPI0012FF2C0D|nr:hypothetical protein [Candidatus Stoquefichus sp. SB1]